MSKGIRRTLQPSLLASKRFIVSACAAIAMVMGAMSVGASMFDHNEPSDHHQQAEASAIFGPDTNKTRGPQDKEPTSPLKTQQTLPEQTLLPENKAASPEATVNVLSGTLNVLKEIIQTPLLTSKLPLKIDTPLVADIVPENIIPKPPVIEEPAPSPEQTAPNPTLPEEPALPPAEDQPSGLGMQSVLENPTE